MAKLILQCEDRAAQEYAVEQMVTIGRLADNIVVLDHPSVSSHHACVFSDGEQCIVEDLQSTNGTFVNGRRVTRRTLRNGDVVVVGTHKIVFDQLASAESGVRGGADSISNNGETVFLDNRTLIDKLFIDSDTYRKNEALSARLTDVEHHATSRTSPSFSSWRRPFSGWPLMNVLPPRNVATYPCRLRVIATATLGLNHP